ncbi:hypothetical protein HanRHA438_Chr02g0088761 [Helianthus annuus]|nr:hypothetical protein HanRHA438_Chr02g0088761 [Helianthus annuus]
MGWFGVPDGGMEGSVSSSTSILLPPEKWSSGPSGLGPTGSSKYASGLYRP